LVLAGEADADQIERFVAAWHQSDARAPLHEFLGFDEDEYRLWLEQPRLLPFLLESRRCALSLRELLENEVASTRQTGGEARLLLDWLRGARRT
jgi:hypothetical protein